MMIKSLILEWYYVLIAKLLTDAIIKNPLEIPCWSSG